MSLREPTPTSTNGSTSSFVDAPEVVDITETEDKETLKEEPLSTPNHSRIQEDPEDTVTNETQTNKEESSKTDIVTIFDVATEIENMLKDIVCIELLKHQRM